MLCQFYTEVLDPKITKSATSIKEQGISKINQKHGLYRNGIDIGVFWYYKKNISVSFCTYIYRNTRFADKWYINTANNKLKNILAKKKISYYIFSILFIIVF